MSNNKNLIATGARLVSRHQRILWWIFAVSFLLSYLGTLAPAATFGKVLDHSLVGPSQFVRSFNLLSFAELMSRPDVPMNTLISGSVAPQIVFFFFMLFIAGGILTVYREDRHLTTSEFFEASGLYFWRFFRLVLLSLVPFAVIMGINAGFGALGDKLADATPRQDYVFYYHLAVDVIVVLMLLIVRLWFDIAQVRAVAQNERGMIRNTWRAMKISWRALGTLLWMYFRISLIAWIVLGAGLWFWSYFPSSAYPASWLLLEIILIVQIAVRLWLRASAITWYQSYAEVHPALAADATTPKPLEIVEPTTVAGESPL